MAETYRITLTEALVADIERRSEADQDVMVAFVSQLRIDGFDLIAGAKAIGVPGLDVEFIEPGEIPDMVWARFFLSLDDSAIVLMAHQKPDRLVLDLG